MGCSGSFSFVGEFIERVRKKKLPTQRRVRKEPEDNDVML